MYLRIILRSLRNLGLNLDCDVFRTTHDLIPVTLYNSLSGGATPHPLEKVIGTIANGGKSFPFTFSVGLV